MPARPFTARAGDAELVGWVKDAADGDRSGTLLLHGGPGLSYDYLDGLADELAEGGRAGGSAVASYQQRGLAPSSTGGPFGVGDHLNDLRSVLDALQWDRVVLVGHSWGGHLALHAAVTLVERTTAVLCIDPLGGVDDGGEAELIAEIQARMPGPTRAAFQELDDQPSDELETPEDAAAGFRLAWPAYFPRWESAPPAPPFRLSVDCFQRTFESLRAALPGLEHALPSIASPVGFLVGARSPLPMTASVRTAERIPGSWVEVVEDAGHFPWLDAPGCVRSALARLPG